MRRAETRRKGSEQQGPKPEVSCKRENKRKREPEGCLEALLQYIRSARVRGARGNGSTHTPRETQI